MKFRIIRWSVYLAIVLSACATRKEALHPPEIEQQQISQHEPSPSLQTATEVNPQRDEAHPSPPSRPPVLSLLCAEDTHENFNLSGMETMPFLRVTFFDVDGDGLVDMVVGMKDGHLRLYRNSGNPLIPCWKLVNGYFDGISSGAFSSPVIADLDGDGRAEVLVGTGGFSSESGRVLVYANGGTETFPRWSEVKGVPIKVGGDATVTAVDYTLDGKPDLIVGNSEGRISFFKNISKPGLPKFKLDHSPLGRRSFGMYAMPAAIQIDRRIILLIGNAMGELYLFDLKRNRGGMAFAESRLRISEKRFLSPAFVDILQKGRFDLVLADGDGGLMYYTNKGNFTTWKKNLDLFTDRLYTRPVCAPTVSHLNGKTLLVVGNIDGTFQVFEFHGGVGLPWIERHDLLKGIKLVGFSRGMLTEWNGKQIFITGQSNGTLSAFVNIGSDAIPEWKEEKGFFQGIQVRQHSTPTAFDIDGDGIWELITGASDGRVYAYRMRLTKNGLPVWEEIPGLFDAIRVEGFSTPTLVRYKDMIFLFVGQQDGSIATFVADIPPVDGDRPIDYTRLAFRQMEYLKDFRMNTHSSPFVRVNGDAMELVSGDYDGNLRHFNCRLAVTTDGLMKH